MNRGSAEAENLLAYASGRFNEAPIHESGKFSRLPRVSSSVSSFNEAPIHESGK